MNKKHEMILTCPECHGTGSDFGCDYCKNTGQIICSVKWETEEIEKEILEKSNV